MDKIKLTLLAALLLTPSVALAHGEEAVVTFLIITVLIIIFLVFILTNKGRRRKKIVLIVTYLGTLISAFAFINMLPYRDNMDLINGILLFIPFIAVLIANAVFNSICKKS